MKKLSLLIMLLAIVGLSAFYEMPEPLKIGDAIPMPELSMNDISGKKISLNDAKKSNGLLVMFSCNTCPVVVANQSRANAVCKFASENNIGVLVLNSNEGNRSGSESLAAMKAYANKQEYKWYYAEDKNNVLADAFGASRTPEIFLFNNEGKLTYHGAIDDSPQDAESVKRPHLVQAMQEMLSGKAVSISKTKSVGCGIKRI